MKITALAKNTCWWVTLFTLALDRGWYAGKGQLV